MLGIIGARGVGKATMILQHIRRYHQLKTMARLQATKIFLFFTTFI